MVQTASPPRRVAGESRCGRLIRWFWVRVPGDPFRKAAPGCGSRARVRACAIAPSTSRALATALACLALLVAGCSYGTPQPATGVTSSGATLHGTVQSDSDGGSTYWFEYGKTRLLGSTTPQRTTPAADRPPYAVQEAISGLEPGTVYRFRLCARDNEGQETAGCN